VSDHHTTLLAVGREEVVGEKLASSLHCAHKVTPADEPRLAV